MEAEFQQACIPPSGLGVGHNFVSEALQKMRPNHEFAIVATQAGKVVGVAKCALHNMYVKRITTRRILSIDLLCSQLRGIGGVILREIEAFARDKLGVHLLVLDSVSHPNTLSLYRRNGFKRVLDDCSHGSTHNQAAQAKYEKVMKRKRVSDHMMNALQQRYLELNNLKESTVFMSKCIRNPRMNANLVEYRGNNGLFRQHRSYHLSSYRNTGSSWTRT